MHTLAIVQTVKQVKDLVDQLCIVKGYTVKASTSTITVHDGEVKKLSAISRDGKNWSVQVSADVAKEYSLSTWAGA